jgi:RsiW-degrading membrane proteinase PrsW (M82 family)
MHLVGIALATATIGVLSLLMFQFMAEATQHFRVHGRGLLVLVFFIFKLIGFSYRAAMDPENGFLLSFFGFTVGVGLCEELTKAMPILIRFRGEMTLDWRGACLWGMASGVGFGVAEGIIYSSDYYNGISGPGIYIVRFISCVGLHAIWSAAVGIMMWHNQEAINGDSEWGDAIFGLLKILIIPIILHGLYDTLLKREINMAALVIAVMSFGWLAWLIQTSAGKEGTGQAQLSPA